MTVYRKYTGSSTLMLPGRIYSSLYSNCLGGHSTEPILIDVTRKNSFIDTEKFILRFDAVIGNLKCFPGIAEGAIFASVDSQGQS